MGDLEDLEKKRDALVKSRSDSERRKALKMEIFRLEHPVQAKIGNAVLNVFKPRSGAVNAGTSVRKTKLKKKVATMADVDSALKKAMGLSF